MKRVVAVALVRGWQSDSQMFRFSADILESVGFPNEHAFVLQTPIRAFIAQRNRMASDLCWEGKFVSAVNSLVSHGLERADRRYKNQVVIATRKIEAELKANKKINNARWDAHMRSNQWAVCK